MLSISSDLFFQRTLRNWDLFSGCSAFLKVLFDIRLRKMGQPQLVHVEKRETCLASETYIIRSGMVAKSNWIESWLVVTQS